MEESLETYALWGTGDITPVNAKTLLDEYIPEPDKVGSVYRPEYVGRELKGLRIVQDYFEDPSYGGAGATEATTDPLASLLEAREQEGDSVYLLMLWPENPTREDFAFVRSFQDKSIPVLDLCRAMDELDLTLYTEPEPPKEPAVKKTRARKTPVEPAPEAPVEPKSDLKTAVEAEISRAAEIERTVSERAHAGKPFGTEWVSDQLPFDPPLPEMVTTTIASDCSGTMQAESLVTPTLSMLNIETGSLEPTAVELGLLRLIRIMIRDEVAEQLAFNQTTLPEGSDEQDMRLTPREVDQLDRALYEDDTPAVPKLARTLANNLLDGADKARVTGTAPIDTGDDTPPFDGPYVGIDTTPWYRSKVGKLRPAEGKPRRGEIAQNLTAEEVEEARKAGRISD
jgi:hypothetical protein